MTLLISLSFLKHYYLNVNDYIVGVSRVYMVYSDIVSTCILQTIQDIVIETSNIDKTNINPSSEDWLWVILIFQLFK